MHSCRCAPEKLLYDMMSRLKMVQKPWEVERLWEPDTMVAIEQWTLKAIVPKVRLVAVVPGVATWPQNVVVLVGGDGEDGDDGDDDDEWNS